MDAVEIAAIVAFRRSFAIAANLATHGRKPVVSVIDGVLQEICDCRFSERGKRYEKRQVYELKINLLSDKNRKADFLATDIKKNGQGKVIYFDSFEAALAKKQEGDDVSFFLIKEDGAQNTKDAVRLMGLCEGISDIQIRIYVFTSSEIDRMVLDSLDTKWAELILIDPLEIMAQRLMMDYPLYEAPDRIKADELRVAIIGGGSAVPVLSKTVHWCGRMKSYIMKINIIGPKAQALETEMKWRCPGLFTQMSQENLDMKQRHLITPELYLPLKLTRTLYHQADTNSEELELALDKCLESNYIIIDEGDDEATLRTALAVRAHFIRKYILHENFLTGGNVSVTKMPEIHVLIRDEILTDMIPNLKVEGHEADPGRDELALIPFGAYRDIYNVENIIDTEIEKLTCVLFPKEYAKDENGRPGGALPVSTKRMLQASAVHLKYKMRDMGFVAASENAAVYNEERFPGICTADDQMIERRQSEMRYELAALEHQRWVIFKLCDGWIPADAYHAIGYGRVHPDGTREHRQFAGKMNAACIEISYLSGAGSKLCGNPSYFTEYDRQTGIATYGTLKTVYPNETYVKLFEDEEEE